ncbi:MAG: OmpA family protein [Pseudomonadota bacterium]
MLRLMWALGAMLLVFSGAMRAEAADLCHLSLGTRPSHCPADDRIATLAPDLRENHVFFPRGGANLDADARKQVALLARVLNTQVMAGTCLKLVGHSDSSGGAAANAALSTRRANAVRDALLDAIGADAPAMIVAGMGEDDLLPDLPSTHVAQRRVALWARECQM